MNTYRTSTVLASFLALGLAAGAAGADERDHELCPRHTGKILYTQIDADAEIYSVAPGGTPKNLTNDPRADYQPSLSPDGRHIAWSRLELDGATQNLWIMDADGSHPHRLNSQQAGDPRWSPDGRRLAFSIRNDDFSAFEVGVMDADGRNVHILTNNGYSIGPDWSPDGREIAMGSRQFNALGALDLVVMRPDGSHMRKILTLPDGDDVWYPRYSPDGRRFVFNRDAGGMWLVGEHGDHLQRVANTTDDDLEANWSPDGRWFTYLESTEDSSQIFIIRTNGEDAQPVSANDLAQYTPDWGR